MFSLPSCLPLAARLSLCSGAVALLVLAAPFGAADAMAAEPSPSPAPAPARRAIVHCACEADDAEKLHASLGELLTRLNVDLDWKRVSTLDISENTAITKEQVAVAWVDIRPNAVDITLGFRKANETSLTLVRRKLERQDGAPLALEATAHVLQAAIEDVLAAEKADAEAEAAKAAKVPLPSPEEDKRSGFALDLGAAFGGRAYASTAPFVFGGGAFVKVAAGRGQWRPALSLLGTFHVPFTADGSLIQLETQTLALRLLPSLTLYEGKSWALEGVGGGGADIFFVDPRSSVVPRSVLRNQTDVAPVLTLGITARVALAEAADIFVTLGADADLAPPRYVTETANVHSEVFTPGRIRPFLLVGFAVTAFGPKPYAPPPGSTP